MSHDRFFVDRLVDHCFIFKGLGDVQDFPGNYSDYRQYEELQTEAKRENPQKKVEITIKVEENPNVESAHIRRKRSFKEQFELDNIEKELPELQNKKSSMEGELSKLGDQYDKIVAFSQELKEITDRIDELELRWLELND